MLINADSHTCGGGALNCAARGVGLPEMLFAVTTGKSWFRVGETIRYDLTGRLRPGVSAKDVFLHIAGTFGAHVNDNVEFGGPGMAGLSLNARRTLAIMGTELSAEFVDLRARRDAALVRPRAQSRRGLHASNGPTPTRATRSGARSRSMRSSRWWHCPTRW